MQNFNRALPKNILASNMNPDSYESMQVVEKYSSPHAAIGEESVDMVALIYMNPEAILYWLPKFLHYLQHKASPDSFHFDSMLFKLSNNSWVYEMQEFMNEEERSMVRNYLTWLGTHISVTAAGELGKAQYAYAVQLWK